jgi:NADP-dependent 3-hydroxy acid dehydrogenase YdfG
MASKVVIVTGASGGIGLAVAKHLIARSHKVLLVARRQAPLEELKAAHPDQVDFVAADLTDYSTAPGITQHAVAKFGRLDGLVINHGVLTPLTKLADANVDDWARLYQTNLLSGVALVG